MPFHSRQTRTRPKAAALLTVAAWLAVACSGPAPQPPVHDRPDVLLLVVDTLRADHLGAYDREVHFTPHLDAFAAESVVFLDAIAPAPLTINCGASLLTSTYPSEHGYSNYRLAVAEGHVTLAEAMRRLGYDTFAVSTNPHVTARNGLGQGFDTFLDNPIWTEADAHQVNRIFLEWLAGRTSQRPYFALLWYIDPHSPYAPPEETVAEVVPTELRHLVGERTSSPENHELSAAERTVSRSLYRGEIGYFDDQFRDLVAALRERGEYDDALVVFTSDHGESLWERSGPDGEPLVGHGRSLFREEIWVPLIVKLPGSRATGGVEDRVSLLDVMPTLLELAGAGEGGGGRWEPLHERMQGRSLAASLKAAGAEPGEVPTVSELFTDHGGTVSMHMESIETEDGKLVRTYAYDGVPYRPHLESILDRRDHPLPEGDPRTAAVRERLRSALDRWRSTLRPVPPRPIPPGRRDGELKERLRALGYLD